MNYSSLVPRNKPLYEVEHLEDFSGDGTKSDPLDLKEGTLELNVSSDYTYGENLFTNGNFSSSTGWTATGWTIASNKATHTTGNASVLSYTLTDLIVATKMYKIVVTTSDRTTGTLTMTWNGTSIGSISSNNTYTKYVAGSATSPVAGLIIYNSTTNKHQGYNGSTWNDFY